MAQRKRRFWQAFPLAPTIGAMFGLAAAVLIAATPLWLFEQAVVSTGIADLVAFAKPPLGMKARLVTIVFAFVLAGGLTWSLVMLAEQVSAPRKPKPEPVDDMDNDELDLAGFAEPVVGTKRRPIFADRELGAPLMSDEVLLTRTIPEALPEKLPEPVAVVMPEPEPVPELAVPLAVEEFAQADVPAVESVAGESSIDALIRRLEAGLAKRGGPPPSGPAAVSSPVSLSDWARSGVPGPRDPDSGATRLALSTLRKMAAR